MIRFLGVSIFVIVFLIVSIPLMIVEWMIGKFNMDTKNRSSQAIVNWAFRVCLRIAGTRITVLGKENVPEDRAVLYVGNHRSFFDILITSVGMTGPAGFVAKKEMLKLPLLVNWMKNLHCLFLDRKDLKEGMKTILAGIEKIRSGISICIFPEGTRNKVNDTFLPFHGGSFKMAEKSGCPVVPMALNNTAAIFEDNFPRMRKAHVILEYGKPIFVDQLDKTEKKKICEMAEKQIRDMYFKNKELI